MNSTSYSVEPLLYEVFPQFFSFGLSMVGNSDERQLGRGGTFRAGCVCRTADRTGQVLDRGGLAAVAVSLAVGRLASLVNRRHLLDVRDVVEAVEPSLHLGRGPERRLPEDNPQSGVQREAVADAVASGDINTEGVGDGSGTFGAVKFAHV